MNAPRHLSLRWLIGFLIPLFLLLFSPLSWGGEPLTSQSEKLPKELQGVDIAQRLGKRLPLELEFTDSTGEVVSLGELFSGKRPVLLTLNYFRCPGLCTQQLNAMLEVLRKLEWTAGKEFDVLTISFDTRDTSETARLKEENYSGAYGRGASRRGWRFLTGQDDAIKTLCKSVGFKYRWLSDRQEFSHAAFLAACTPDGRLSRYLAGSRNAKRGMFYAPGTVRLALVESSGGKIGSAMDQVLLFCFLQYDGTTGKYSLAVMRLVQVGGAITFLCIGGWLLLSWRRARRKTGVEAAHPANHED